MGGAQRAFEAELLSLLGGQSRGVSGCGTTCGGVKDGSVAAAPQIAEVRLEAGPASDRLSTSAAELRRQLVASLGNPATFDVAHARLQQSALGNGEEDDVLASGQVQELLGERHRELLPLMLKLIFLEEQTRVRRPW
jgi:hypothetical protein